MTKIAILGGGVSGSLLAYLLRTRTNYEVNLFDIKDKYVKPCGDIVPNVYTPPIPWDVKFRIKRFAFYLDGELIHDIEYRNTKWLVIDKWGWINKMREEVKTYHQSKFNRKNYDKIIDAKGPYDMDREVVYTTRALVKTEKFDDVAVFEFDTKYTGFYWIFPNEDGILNIGAGFLEYKNSRELILKYIKEKYGDAKIIDIRGAPISISPVKDKNYRIGEARGLVFPLSGEGIRPSAISAERAFEALYKEENFNEYMENSLKKLHYAVDIQHMLLRVYRYSSLSLRRSLLRILFKNDILLDAYLEDKITFEGISESVKAIKNGGLLRK
ncbi:NAD(P)/FAD-dependent oxidoreductase [Sulfurisphaera ohwakuensis]|uniref:NAD(P)/FAD-dependent oxidoreductase n=1 Tax=Sulfurisphaera ohwakuensis TaxID=69656 RepID=UPI0036F33B3F